MSSDHELSQQRTEAGAPDAPELAASPPATELGEPLVRSTSRELATDVGGRRLDRRRLLTTGAATGVAATAATLAATAVRSQDATPATDATPAGDMTDHDMAGMEAGPETNAGFTYFVPFQAQVVQAAAARLIPTDENGPGATEAGVVYFIDRQLAKQTMGFRGKEYQLGPYQAGEATQGDQSALSVGERFRIGIFGLEAFAQDTFGKGFVECAPEEQDQLLTSLSEGTPENFGGIALQASPLTTAPTGGPQISEDVGAGVTLGSTAFFNLLLQWTMAGFFCDPVQGGNRDMVGWKMIGFPGAHISWAEQIENYNQPFEGDFISLGQYQEQVGGGLS
jgi:gluconate 2-dehydrogenase gamma chain